MPTTPSTNLTPRQDYQAALEAAPLDFIPIAERIFIPTKAPGKKGAFDVIPIKAAFATPDVKASNKAGGNRSTFEMNEQSYSTKPYKHEEPLTDEDEGWYESVMDMKSAIIRRGKAILARAYEIRCKNKVQDTATFTGAANTLAVTVKWSVPATATPIADINVGKQKIRLKCGMSNVCLQIGWQTWLDLSLCAQIRGALQYTQQPQGVIPLDALASALGVAEIICPGDANMYDSADEGQAASLAEIWDPQYAFLFVRAPGTDIKQPGFGRTLYWERRGGMMQADDYFEDQTESTIIRVKSMTDEVRIGTSGTDYGFLYSNVA